MNQPREFFEISTHNTDLLHAYKTIYTKKISNTNARNSFQFNLQLAFVFLCFNDFLIHMDHLCNVNIVVSNDN
jgi:hypothetical protein